jgi:hypothetical protein
MPRVIFQIIFVLAVFLSVGGWLWLLLMGARWLIAKL